MWWHQKVGHLYLGPYKKRETIGREIVEEIMAETIPNLLKNTKSNSGSPTEPK